MEPINTVVQGTPSSCRATADMMGKLDRGVVDVGTGLNRARSESETCWTGKAGDAFRTTLTKKGKLADDLAEAAGRAEKALNTFADELQTVIGMIKQARGVAREHGLTVTPAAIQPPGPAPKAPAVPDDPTALPIAPKEYTAAKAEYDRAVRGYKEAKATVERARKKEAAAHKALETAMNYEVDLLTYLKRGLQWTLIGVDQAMLTTPQASADTFTEKANTFHSKAAKTATAADDAALTVTQRADKLIERDKMNRKAARAEAEAAKSQKVADRVARRTGVGPTGSRVLGKTVGKTIPVVGTGLAVGVQAEAVINDGKPVGKATANVVGGIIGGAVSGAVTGGMVGGPVGVAVGVVAGAVASGVGSYLGEETYDAFTED